MLDTLLDKGISRRSALIGAGAVAAWLASPARALLQTASRLEVPAFIDALIARMTVEEKAGQLSLMASAMLASIVSRMISRPLYETLADHLVAGAVSSTAKPAETEARR